MSFNDSITGNPRFIVFITKGLKDVSEKEIKTYFSDAIFLHSSDKYIIFTIKPISPGKLLKLKTVDDVHFLAAYFKNMKNLNEVFIVKNLPVKDFSDAQEFIRRLRKIDNTFSVTVSKYKNDSLNLESLKMKIANRMIKYTNRIYTKFDHSNFDIRIHVECSNVIYSCRLPQTSLYVRSYRKCEMMGSLKPPIAAALCLLIYPKIGEKIVDNFCGTGTILCEAALLGLEPYGGDINEESVFCAHRNIRSISPEAIPNIKVLNATSTKWPDKYFDYAISNYPWGKHTALDHVVKLYSESISEYARILKDNGSIVLLGIKPKLIAKHLKKNFPYHEITQFKIGFLGQTPWVSIARPRAQLTFVNLLHSI